MADKNTKAGSETPGEAPAAAPVMVWFVVEKHEAVIGECHHAEGKRMQLPKPVAEEAVAQGLGRLDGVVG